MRLGQAPRAARSLVTDRYLASCSRVTRTSLVREAVLQDIDNLLAHQESEVLTLAEAERSVHRRLSRPYPSPACLHTG